MERTDGWGVERVSEWAKPASDEWNERWPEPGVSDSEPEGGGKERGICGYCISKGYNPPEESNEMNEKMKRDPIFAHYLPLPQLQQVSEKKSE